MTKFYKFMVYILVSSFFVSWIGNVDAYVSITTSYWNVTTDGWNVTVDQADGNWTTSVVVDQEDEDSTGSVDEEDSTGSVDEEDSTDTTVDVEDDTNTEDWNTGSTLPARRVLIKNRNVEIRNIQEDKKAYLKKKKEQQKANLMEFKMDNIDGMKEIYKDLDQETKDALQQEKEETLAAQNELLDKLNDSTLTVEERYAIKAELVKLREASFDNMIVILAWNDAAIALLEARKAVFEENQAIRTEISDARQEFKDKKAVVIEKYKGVLSKKLVTKLDNIPTDKLETVAAKITDAIDKITASVTMSVTKKNTYLTQLEALLDLINQRLNEVDQEEEFDIEALLDV